MSNPSLIAAWPWCRAARTRSRAMRIIPLLLMFLLAAAASSSEYTRLEPVLEQLGIEVSPESLTPAPIRGFLEVTRGMQVLYVAADGSMVLDGEILSVATATNLTERRRASIRRELLRSIAKEEAILVPASEPVVARIFVFIDTNCPYCVSLHRGHEELRRRGIEIQYLFYPRSGPASASFKQAVAVWCSNDRLAALEDSLGGVMMPEARCPNPVRKHYDLAQQLELKGTPAVIAANGAIRYGMISADDIAELARGAEEH